MKTTESPNTENPNQLPQTKISISTPRQNFKKLETILEKTIFNSRWLLTPFYVCLVFTIALIFIKFFQEFLEIIPLAFSEGEGTKIIIYTLNIIDLVLLANLLLIIVFSGYESFVSKFDIGEQIDRPEWMGKISYSSLKIKVIGSIVTISAIELLKSFINLRNIDLLVNEQLFWRVTIHITLVISGLLFAMMDKNTEHK